VKPSKSLEANRQAVHAMVMRYNATNPRVFGSVSLGTDHERSDLDLLVDALPQATLLDLGGLQLALEALLGVSVDVCTLLDLPVSARDEVLRQARPV
jgi:uncharacterized protein